MYSWLLRVVVVMQRKDKKPGFRKLRFHAIFESEKHTARSQAYPLSLTYTLIGVSKRICTKLPEIAPQHSDQLPVLVSAPFRVIQVLVPGLGIKLNSFSNSFCTKSLMHPPPRHGVNKVIITQQHFLHFFGYKSVLITRYP